jgi:hypothetical protein
MNKIDRYTDILRPQLEKYLRDENGSVLEEYLMNESGLPSPRANLELAQAFGRVIEELYEDASDRITSIIDQWIDLSKSEAPTGNPREFLVFCGVIGLGAIAALQRDQLGNILIRLREKSNDGRWRVREAVCFALQRLLYRYGVPFSHYLEQWAQTGTPYELRAAAVSVADPSLLENTDFAFKALYVHRLVFSRFRNYETVSREARRVFVQGISFSLSVVITALPEAGFDFLADLAHINNKDIQKILKTNLAKDSLTAEYPEQTSRISDLLL